MIPNFELGNQIGDCDRDTRESEHYRKYGHQAIIVAIRRIEPRIEPVSLLGESPVDLFALFRHPLVYPFESREKVAALLSEPLINILKSSINTFKSSSNEVALVLQLFFYADRPFTKIDVALRVPDGE